VVSTSTATVMRCTVSDGALVTAITTGKGAVKLTRCVTSSNVSSTSDGTVDATIEPSRISIGPATDGIGPTSASGP